MSQAESIENYNRREIIRTIGLKEDVEQIDKISQDISPARAKFLSMMKRDSRVESALTREGTILKKNLNYDFSEFMKYFRPSRSNIFPHRFAH